MFRPRHRRPPFADPLNWTDYRWEARPWHGGPAGSPLGYRPGRRGQGLLRLLLVALVVFVGARLFSSSQSRNGSWARKGLYAALLIMIAAAFSGARGRHRNW